MLKHEASSSLENELNLDQQPATHELYISFARNQSEIEEAQRLRYKVFAEEMGADIAGEDGLDRDGFDNFCDHLLIRESNTNQVVGTYRILSPKMANEAGGYYSAGEFDMSRLQHLFPQMVEVGRACVHRDYRNGGTITLLWAGLAKYMQMNRYEYMIGCASVPMADGGHMAASLYNKLQDKHLSPNEYRVFPHCPLPMVALDKNLEVDCPPLIKGYLRLGAYICGEPAWDPDFNTADLLVMLPLSRINRRYAAHFLNSATHSSLIVRMIRIARIILHTFYGVFLSTFILPTVTKRQRNWIISYWSGRLLNMMNIQIKIEGVAPTHDLASTMFVGNHISWLDIHVLNSIRAVRFIAKAEIRKWPVFGWLATQTNTLFIEREQKKDAVRVIDTAAKSLMKGDCLCFFPEGTTTDGTELLTFKGSLIQAPINAKAKVWPFVIEYPNKHGKPNQAMAFTGETTLLESIWRIVSLSKPQATITFLPKISPEGHERRGLTIAVRHAIATHLNVPHH